MVWECKSPRGYHFARVMKLADFTGSELVVPKGTCGSDSHLAHHLPRWRISSASRSHREGGRSVTCTGHHFRTGHLTAW